MELSEPATAVCLLFSVRDLRTQKRLANMTGGITSLQEWWLSDAWQNKLSTFGGTKGLDGAATDHADSKKGLDPTQFAGLTTKNLTQIRQMDLIDTASTSKAAEKALSNVAVGISAALSIRQWMSQAHATQTGGRTPEKVYLTGGTWHTDIKSFQVEHAGMKDYNSSDLVLYCGKRADNKLGVYLGVSLKKKDLPVTGDPTLINRSLKAALEQVNNSKITADGTVQWKPSTGSGVGMTPRAHKWIKDIEAERLGFLVDKIIKSTTKTPIAKKWRDGSQKKVQQHTKFPVAKTSMTFREALKTYEGIDIPTERDMEKLVRMKVEAALYSGSNSGARGKWRELINMKGSSGRDGPIRDIVNERVASSKNAYFNAMKDVLTSPGNTAIEMAEELTDHILKIELRDKLKKSGVLKDYYFGFSLCTGIAVIHKLTSGYRITISDGETKDADSILCALNKLSRVSKIAGKSKGFKFELQEAQQRETFAGLKATITKGGHNIIQIDVRYKGDFTAKPDFQATIHPDFIHTYLHGCPPGGH